LRIEFVKRYAFWQGFSEASYANENMGSERKQSYTASFRNLFSDIFTFSKAPRQDLKKKRTLLTATFYFVLGYASLRHDTLFAFGNSLLED